MILHCEPVLYIGLIEDWIWKISLMLERDLYMHANSKCYVFCFWVQYNCDNFFNLISVRKGVIMAKLQANYCEIFWDFVVGSCN